MKRSIFSQEGDRKGIQTPSAMFVSVFVLSGSLLGRYQEPLLRTQRPQTLADMNGN